MDCDLTNDGFRPLVTDHSSLVTVDEVNGVSEVDGVDDTSKLHNSKTASTPKLQIMKKFFSLFVIVVSCVMVMAQKPGDVVILYDNDVHCAVAGYPVMAGLRDSLSNMGCQTAVVSSGDFSFGGPVGAASRGEFVIRMMNAVGYDAVVLGNHEFDYGVMQLCRLERMLDAPMLCCNFRPNEYDYAAMVTGKYSPTPFLPFVIRNYGGVKVAFVGVTTPTTMTTSTPTSFQDAEGNFIYNFSSTNLAATVQNVVNQVRAIGVDLVVLLAHLGDSDGVPTSVQLVSEIKGVDVVLDGHDHHLIPCRNITDKDGKNVLLTSTGTQFDNVGMMIVTPQADQRPAVRFKMLPVADLRKAGCVSKAVADTLNVINKLFDEMGNRIVASTQQPLVATENDVRVCRLRETNLGDLIADAYRVGMKADIGWINGGGIRANVLAGPITHNQLFAVCPYSNKIRVARVSGEDLLNALETALREYPKAEGCFPQVSGLTFSFNPNVPSHVVIDSNGTFVRVNGEYRVSNVRVNGKQLDLKATYTIASSEYVLVNGGDAISFPSREMLPVEPANDLTLLEQYIQTQLGGVIGEQYAEPQGRIVNLVIDNIPKPKKPKGSYLENRPDTGVEIGTAVPSAKEPTEAKVKSK